MNKLYEGNIKKNFFTFALPLVLSALLSQAYNIINTIMAGYLIGDTAISAIGSTAPFVSFISSLFWGYGTGFSIYVAVLFGRSDYQKMVNVIKVNLLLSAVLIFAVSALCIVFYESIFDFLNIEASLRKQAFDYFSIYIGGIIFLHLTWCGIYISNAIGFSVLPLTASVITNVLNIAGNYIFIKYFNLGVKGTAAATIFSAFCVSVFYFAVFVKTFKKMGLKLSGISFNLTELKYSAHFSFPTVLQQSVMYLCTALVSPLTNLCGSGAIAGYTIGMRIYDVNAGVYQNSNKTVGNYIAQCIGGNKHSMINKGIKISLIQTILFLLPILFLTVFGANPISKMFLDSPDSIYYAELFMKFCMPFVIFNVINNLLHAIFRSAGSGKYLVISTVIYAVSRFGYSYLLFPRFEMYGIYAAMVLSWITEANFGMVIYFSGKWKNNCDI